MILKPFTISLWETGRPSALASGAHISLQRVAIVPHTESKTLDIDCYWHGTVEELRQESPEGKVGGIPPFVSVLDISVFFFRKVWAKSGVLEKEGL